VLALYKTRKDAKRALPLEAFCPAGRSRLDLCARPGGPIVHKPIKFRYICLPAGVRATLNPIT